MVSFKSYFYSLVFKLIKHSGNSLARAIASNVYLSGLEGPCLPPDTCHLI